MYLGNVVEALPGGQLSKDAVHPYTRALMGSVFDINMDFSKPIENLEGEAPSPAEAAGRPPVPGTMHQMHGDLQKRSSANGQPYTGRIRSPVICIPKAYRNRNMRVTVMALNSYEENDKVKVKEKRAAV